MDGQSSWAREEPSHKCIILVRHSFRSGVGVLVHLMLGGLPTGNAGFPLHAQLRYFDPGRQRAGIPRKMAALVARITHDAVTLTLVNTDQTAEQSLVVQGGAYAEHRVRGVRLEDRTVPIDHTNFSVDLAPGCGATLEIAMDRYRDQPTLSFPW